MFFCIYTSNYAKRQQSKTSDKQKPHGKKQLLLNMETGTDVIHGDVKFQ